MRVRVFLFAAVVTICCSLALGQNNATSISSAQSQNSTNNAPPGSKDRPIRVSAGVIAGLILHKIDPVYPEDAKEAEVSGAVVMVAVIDDQGKISKLSVVSGPEKLRDAALTAVNQWTYKPYLLNGKALFVQTQITVNFTLNP